MRALIVEDDFVGRMVLEKIMSKYATCDLAVDGKEALEKFGAALESNPYNLVFLDIMLPFMDGQHVLKAMRALEEKKGMVGFDGVKVVMTTALDDSDNVLQAFRSQCEGYIVKPVTPQKVVEQLKNLDLYDPKERLSET